jgi:hypothetical protein
MNGDRAEFITLIQQIVRPPYFRIEEVHQPAPNQARIVVSASSWNFIIEITGSPKGD